MIIDDNHSFIDLLKNALTPFRFHIDSFYKFTDAREVLIEQGCYFNQSIADQVLKYHEMMIKNPDSAESGTKELAAPLVNPNGYGLIFLEYDAEASIKGTHFINDILKNTNQWTEKNFILMTSNPQKVEPLAKKLRISIIDKPVKKDNLMKLVTEYVNSTKQKENEINKLIEKYSFVVRSNENPTAGKKNIKAVKPVKTASTAPSKKTVKKNLKKKTDIQSS